MANKDKPRIFLCHAKEDKLRVRELYHQLKGAGYYPWLDKEDLLPGQNWREEIRKIISDPYNLVVVCLSRNSVTKRGVFQQEIKWALDALDQTPEGTIYLIPARLERCQAPERLSDLHWVDLYEPDGFEKLKQALNFELNKRKPPRQPFEPELILISAGEFLMGSDPGIDKSALDREQPQHTLYLPDYYLAKTPVTNAQYVAFVERTSHERPKHWEGGKPPKGEENHPVVYVHWHDAVAYCNWLAQVTSKAYRLPSEAEWEKGARGTDGRIYPWGNHWNPERCNSLETGPGSITPVEAYPKGVSPYGLLDMVGNVWEWTRSLWGQEKSKPDFTYPYIPADDREDFRASDNVRRVLRGGAFVDNDRGVRCAKRHSEKPQRRIKKLGFRVCVAPQQE